MQEIENRYKKLLEPSPGLIADVSALKGDILILGAGGKMGPAISLLSKRAVELSGGNKRVIAVSRFSETGLQDRLNNSGIETIAADLLDDAQLQSLPDADNVIYLAGTKFGTQGNEPLTWAMNAYLPGRVADKYRRTRIVAFSTGNVYPLTPPYKGGATEDLLPEPIGEYAQSCLGRERIFQYHAAKNKTPLLIYRLNYANDVSYGVLVEIAKSVRDNKPIDLSMGHVNVIWQGDANEIAIRSLHHCSVPPKLLNVTGPETASVRELAQRFGRLMGKSPIFINEEQPTSLLSNATECFRIFGYPRVTLEQMTEIIAEWVKGGGRLLNKETHFQERSGKF